jgi:hypothetical protein
MLAVIAIFQPPNIYLITKQESDVVAVKYEFYKRKAAIAAILLIKAVLINTFIFKN